ncbi:MAG: hypothetical protein KME09_02525 [Pleurocapsa minor HA4230-MV1]|jgi:hypothetical protein|nr:hypothetical protein [Pleurocapsa minor HA4230-MV1]
MLSTRPFENCSSLSRELELRKLITSNRVSIIYIHGTARSGSTIAEIVLSQLADLTIHQPFRGILQKAGGRFRATKLDFDADIYDSACGLIVKQINQYLQTKQKITVIIKELAGFFQPCIWQRWLEIPDKFLFTIREPHIQYMSWLSAMTDKVFQGEGKFQENRDFVMSKAQITETSVLSAEWEGTTISCNQVAWKALVSNFYQVKKEISKISRISNNSKKIAILDLVLLRYKPEIALENTLKKLGLESKINLTGLSKIESKIWDLRDKNRPMVRKANNSNAINPLTIGEAVSLNIFPIKSQQHIKELIPLYLELLSAPEQAYLPSLAELETTELMVVNPFLAYAIALFHLKNQVQVNNWFQTIAKNKSIKIDNFQGSLAIANNYWEQASKI